ncbi:MAG: tetratricopeptide repeat protein, partial [bacterium]
MSNFEEPSGKVETEARPNLTAWVDTPRRAVVFVSGQRLEVPRTERRRLRALAERDPDSQLVYEALATVNRDVAARNSFVSEACWVVHARLTGDGGGRGFGLEGRPFMPRMAFPAGAEDVIRKLVAEQFGEGRGAITGISTGRAEATEEYHQTQLREKPDDPNAHSNYGAFLIDRGQGDEAEKEYRAALALQPTHANALGNLANLESNRDRLDEAQDLYERALAAEPGHENVSWNFARFLFRGGDSARALEVAEAGSSKNPQSGRLHLLEGELRLSRGDADGALGKVEDARSNGADQAQAETLNAFATQMSRAPLGECIAAYEVAISVRPDEPNLHLNLAQLLFLRGDSCRAVRELPPLDELADDGKLERLFYQLAHT